VIVTEIVYPVVTCHACVGVIVETIAFFLQIAFGGNSFPIRIKGCENQVITFKNAVNGLNYNVGLNILAVIKGTSALIAAKLLIGSTRQLITAI
jgi:ribosomal protein S27E